MKKYLVLVIINLFVIACAAILVFNFSQNYRNKHKISVISNGINLNKYRIVTYNERGDFFVEESTTGKMVIPPPIAITKIRENLVYCYREEKGEWHEYNVQYLNESGSREMKRYPDNIWIVIDVDKSNIRYYSDVNYVNEVFLDFYFE